MEALGINWYTHTHTHTHIQMLVLIQINLLLMITSYFLGVLVVPCSYWHNSFLHIAWYNFLLKKEFGWIFLKAIAQVLVSSKKIRKNHCIYIQSCIHDRYQASFHSWHQWSNFAWKPCVSINANSWRWLILSAFLWLTLYCPSMHLGEWQWQCITYQPFNMEQCMYNQNV